MESDVMEVYNEDTNGRKIHIPTRSKYYTPDSTKKKDYENNCCVINTNLPCDYSSLKKMSKGTRKSYILSLRERFGVTDKLLGDMLGISRSTLNKVLDTNEIPHQSRGTRMSKFQVESWIQFLKCVKFSDKAKNINILTEVEDTNMTIKKMTVTNFNISISGKLDIYKVVEYVESLGLDNKNVIMSISIEMREEE